MSTIRIALANVRVGEDADDSLALALDAIAEAAGNRASIICFPESFVPGYRIGKSRVSCNTDFLAHAWSAIDRAASDAAIAVILTLPP